MRRLSFALIGFGLGILLVWLVTAASASPACMSKQEARAKWPRSHIYWHTSDRCWDNRRGGSYRYRKPLDVKINMASADVIPVPKPVEVYRPIIFMEDVFPRFLPWERRIAGSF